jgi:hypothetical protein
MPSKKISKSSFATEAQAMSQEKGSDAPAAIIVGGGPAGMITGLALSSLGVNVKVLEQRTEDAILRPALDADAYGLDEPLIFSPASLDHLKEWGLYSNLERGKKVRLTPLVAKFFIGDLDCIGVRFCVVLSMAAISFQINSTYLMAQVLDLGPAARRIEYRDFRDLSGRLLRREPLDGAFCLHASDLCARIRAAGEGAAKAGRGRLDVRYGGKVAHFVDISWGVAAIAADSYRCAGPSLRRGAAP